MPLDVAQLNIEVSVDDSQAQAALTKVQQTFQQVAQAAVQGASQEAGAQGEVVAAVGRVESALTAMYELMQEGAAKQVQAAQTVTQSNQQMTASVVGFGAMGSSALTNLNQGLIASGQNIGPLNNGLMMTSMMLRQIPSEASTASKSIAGVATAITAVGIASAGAAAPAQQGLQQLQQVYANVDASISDYQGRIDSAKNHAADLGKTQGDLYNALAILTRGLNDPEKALDRLGQTEDLAAAKGESLAAAANNVVRAFEGYGRNLKQLGIDMVFTHNAQAGLGSAQHRAASTADSLTAAQQRLADAHTRAAARASSAANAVDQVAQAQQRLNEANASFVELQTRMAAEDAVPKISATTTAIEEQTKAQQSLNDVIAKQAAQAEIPITSHAAEVLDRIRDAQERLADTMAKQHDAHQLTQVDYDNMAQSADAVAEAQERMALASGGDILKSQENLRHAISQQREELDRLHLKQQQSISQAIDLKNAQEAVAKAQADLAKAKATDRGEADVRNLERMIAMRDAQQRLTKAVQDTAAAKVKDAAESYLKAITEQQQLHAAYLQIIHAQEALAQAQKSGGGGGAGAVGSELSVAAAQRAVDHQKKIHAEALANLKEAQDKLKAQNEQGTRALDLQAKKTHDAAEAAARGWTGAFNRMKAHLLNFLADFGNAGGRFASFALPFVLIGGQLAKVLGIGGGAAEVAGEGVLAPAIAEAGTAAGVALGPILLIAAAVAIVVGAFALLYFKVQPVHDLMNEIAGFIKDVFVGAWQDVNDAMGGVGATITQLVQGPLNFFQETIKVIGDFLHEHRAELDSLGGRFVWLAGVISLAVQSWWSKVTMAWHIIQPILNAFRQFIGVYMGVAFDQFKAVVKIAWDIIGGYFRIARDYILGVVGVFLDLLAGHWGKAWDDLKKMVVNIWNDIFGILNGVFTHLVDLVVSVGTRIIGAMIRGLTNGFGVVTRFFTGTLPQWIANGISALWATNGLLFRGGAKLIEAIKNGAFSAFHFLWQWVDSIRSGIWDTITSWIKVGGWIWTAGYNLIIGIINGIGGAIGQLWDSVDSIAKTMFHKLTHPWEIFSPSKVTERIGMQIIQGLAIGIDKSTTDAVAAAGRVNDAVASELTRQADLSASRTLGVGAVGGIPAGLGAGVHGGGQVIVKQVKVDVHGTVMQERDLVHTLGEALREENNRQGGNLLPFVRSER